MTATMHELVERAKSIATEIVEPNAGRWDREASWPEAALRALQADGLAGLVVPVAHGGLGHRLEALLRICETLGTADASVALCFGMHCVGTACLAAKSTPDQAERYLVPIARGEHLTTLALSEAGTGSHFYLPETTIEHVDGRYLLRGAKSFVTNGGHADSYVVSAVDAGEEAPVGHFSMVMVSSDAAGASWGEPWQGWGMRGNAARTLKLDGVRIEAAERLGDEGDQIWYVFNVVAPYFLVAMAGTYLGIAKRAVAEAVRHLKTRHYAHSGQSLATVEVLQHRLGQVWSELFRTRSLCVWAAEQADAGGPEALTALCAAKAEVGHASVNVVNDCMTLLGGAGYRDGTLLPRLLRDARAAHVMAPTTDILYTWAGRTLLDLPLLGH